MNCEQIQPMKLLIATRNADKLEEIRAIFAVPSLELVSMNDYPDLPQVVEDGPSFDVNAIKKAVTMAFATKLWTMADDSGLEVDALHGAPGVCSARYAGRPVSYEANNTKLLKELENVTNRKARFRCAVALSSPAGRAQVVEEKCEGLIVDSPRGSNGFGYDPLFMPDGYNQTFAEMESDVKNRISHRASALNLARKVWGDFLARPHTPEDFNILFRSRPAGGR